MGFLEIVTKFFFIYNTPFPDFTHVMLALLVFLSD